MTIKDYKEHLENNSEKIPFSGCWLWLKAKHPDGYGSITYKKKPTKAHRVSYLEFIGPIPDGFFVLHSCDTPSCINPNHLRIGTASDNMKDMVKRGRKLGGNFKLTSDQITEIKTTPKTFGSGVLLAKKFNCSQSQVSYIRG